MFQECRCVSSKATIEFVQKNKAAYECFQVRCDRVYGILNEAQQQIGLIFLSDLPNEGIYIEWLEIMTVFRAHGYLRLIFKNLRNNYPSADIVLQCSKKLKIKYMCIGCEEVGTDDCTEMHIMKYMR